MPACKTSFQISDIYHRMMEKICAWKQQTKKSAVEQIN